MPGITSAVRSFFSVDRRMIAWLVAAGIGYWVLTTMGRAATAPSPVDPPTV